MNGKFAEIARHISTWKRKFGSARKPRGRLRRIVRLPATREERALRPDSRGMAVGAYERSPRAFSILSATKCCEICIVAGIYISECRREVKRNSSRVVFSLLSGVRLTAIRKSPAVPCIHRKRSRDPLTR